MSYATVAASLKSVVEGVSAISALSTPVYDELKVTDKDDQRNAWFTDSAGALHTWQIERQTIRGTREGSYEHEASEFRLHGYLAVSFAGSYKALQAEVDAILAAIRTHVRLVNTVDWQGAPSGLVDAVKFCGVLCWHALITLPTAQIEAPTMVP